MVTIDMLGFTNAVIYIRPRFLKFRRDYPTIGIASSLWHTLVRTRPTPASPTRRFSTTTSHMRRRSTVRLSQTSSIRLRNVESKEDDESKEEVETKEDIESINVGNEEKLNGPEDFCVVES